MSSTSQDEKTTGKSLVNKDESLTKLTEWATADANSVEEMERLFEGEGVSYSSGEELTGDYQVITGDLKQAFLNRVSGCPLFVVRWEFYDGERPGTEFVASHMVIDGHGKFILNDGAKSGMYGQLRKITDQRINMGQTNGREKAGIKARGGFKKNREFYFDTRTNKAIPRGAEVPAEFRQKAHDTWSLVF